MGYMTITMSLPQSLNWAHPLVQEWFTSTLGLPTEPQMQGWPPILSGKTTLISAPTGSGKTFAAFLVAINYLITKSLNGTLENETEILYISPLKALSNDIQKNLMTPLNGVVALAKAQGLIMEEINVVVRTGDTPPGERQRMLRKPPHILVTTPESLYILLTAEKSRHMLTSIKTVIVDEIHALANSKRGVHLSLSLERLHALTQQCPMRIGLSATQKPIEKVANFLTGNFRAPAVIVDIGHVKPMELVVEVPVGKLESVASNNMWEEIYERLASLAGQNRSTLIFTNTRKAAERVAHHLAAKLGQDQVVAHHGSLSRKLRLSAETRLKNGELKALVATASLELGIDIGTVDLVCQLGSPRAIAIMLQRVGRAGHWHGAISRGHLFATTRDDLLECAALVRAIHEGDLDQLIMPQESLDILAQQIVASCASGDWLEDDLFAMVKQSYSYNNLSRETFDTIIDMLSEGIAGSRGRYGALLLRDGINKVVKARRGSRLIAITNGGAIPDNSLFTVITESTGAVVGTLDEEFSIESHRGDIILLGSTSWKIKRIESACSRVIVEDAHGAPPNVPFWIGESPGRTLELSRHLSRLRQAVSDQLPFVDVRPGDTQDNPHIFTAMDWLKKQCHVDDSGAEQIITYILEGRALLKDVPTQKTVIAERFFDEAGDMQLVIHAPFGSRINKAWGLALRKCFCRAFNVELQASATENGIHIALTEQHSFPLADVFDFLNTNTIKKVVVQAVLQSPLFATRWRWDAGRALALVRFRNGRKVPPNLLRMLSEDLLTAVFPQAVACQDNLAGRDIELPDHPLVNETMKDCLTEALDIDGLISVLNSIKNKEIRCIAIDTLAPSAFSHEILNANPYAFLDDVPLEERRTRAVEMRRILPLHLLHEIGRLDPIAIDEVRQQTWPDIRNADELHDFLQTIIAFPAHFYKDQVINWQVYFNELVSMNRVGMVIIDNRVLWFAAEKAKIFSTIYPEVTLNYQADYQDRRVTSREDCLMRLIQGWMSYLGPITTDDLGQLLQLGISDIKQTVMRLEASGLLIRGSFQTTTEDEWCDRRLLARIHRITLGRLRKEIEPVSPSQFVNWLLRWQHLAQGTQLSGENGLLAIIKQLQGFEIPAKSWERDIFTKRMSDYDPVLLDRLCLGGMVGWGRVHADTRNMDSKRVVPSSIAPITFFVRESSQWMPIIQHYDDETELTGLSYVAKDIYFYLQQHGASFFMDIVGGVAHLKSEVELGIWELVTAGMTTADSFDNLRSLIDPRRRLIKKRRHNVHHYYSSGRWSILKTPAQVDAVQQIEATCRLLLQRYGVVFRDLLTREKLVPRWRELLFTFRRLEERGEIRGGRFVDGFSGEQFALPYAADSLRAIKRKEPDTEMITISVADPLNVTGFILPGLRIPAISGKKISLQDGILLP